MALRQPDQPAAGANFDESFSHAADEAGVVKQELTVAGRPVVIQYAGERMRDTYHRPFTHLEQEHNGLPDLTISVWDSAESMTSPPPLPASLTEAEDGHKSIVKGRGVKAIFQHGPNLLTAFAPGQGRAWVWINDRASIPPWEAAAPFKMVWKWWSAEAGHTMLHAGAVADGVTGALLVGSGGRGKSTTAIACLEAGFSYVGDDYVILDSDGETVHSLYCTAKLKNEHPGRFAASAETDIGLGRGGPGAGQAFDKRVLLLIQAFSNMIVPSVSIGAVVAPQLRLDRKGSLFEPITGPAALLATAASSMIQLPDSGAADLTAMARLVERMPTYSLQIGSDVRRIPDAMRGILSEVTHG